jgi:ABC-2 type transport system ATP-binding protein
LRYDPYFAHRKESLIVIEIKEIEKYYAGKKALDKINFTVNKGEILGFLGPNGAGKSTTMNIITGYIAPTNGTALIDGFDIIKESKKAKSKIGYLPEQPPLYVDMTVKSYLSFMYDLKKVNLNKQEHINEICEKVGISDVYNRIIKKLSKGYKQRIGIAQALIGYPPVIILDEPTVGLDPKQIISIRNLIKGLAQKHTVIFSSHILSEIRAVCSRILVINKGKIVADNPAELLSGASRMSNKIIAHIDGNTEKAQEIMKGVEGVLEINDITHKGDDIYEYIVTFEKGCDIRREMFKALAQNDMPIIKFDIVEPSLEDVFIELTSREDVPENNQGQNADSMCDKSEETAGGDSGDGSEGFAEDIDSQRSDSDDSDI